MKKIFISLLLLAAVCVSAQEVPTSFPRKYLIEHFTGDQCGYCPGGMYSIVHYTMSLTTTPCIWVSHHYGFNNDEYTISESAKIGAACGVQGAPSMAMNRTKMMGQTIAFHPGYLTEPGIPETIASNCATEAEASVVIEHTYNAETRELNVTVSGQVANTDVTEYLLSVLIKENGLVGKQADYAGYSWKSAGFKEFLHPCVVRDVISVSPLGDTVIVENQAYSKTYTYTISEEWVAENCNVIAYITPLTKKPIINAEETPLVAGTTGGKEYLPFGITENLAPTNATKLNFDTLELGKPADDKLAIRLVSASSTRSDVYGPVKLVVYLEFNTPESTLSTGTYEFADGNELNTLTAGHVDLATQIFSGSHMAYYKASTMEDLCHIWRITSGTMTVEANGGFIVEGKLDNGKNYKVTYELPTAVDNVVFDKAHVEKLIREGKCIIRINDVEYDMQGRMIK